MTTGIAQTKEDVWHGVRMATPVRVEENMAGPIVTRVIHQVLLVENDDRDAGLIREALDGRPDSQLHIVPDVVGAIRFLAKRDGFIHAPTPDLILLALRLRHFPGTALLEERRRRPTWGRIPVVVLGTASDDRPASVARGADDHVVKPADPTAWRQLMEGLLSRHLPVAGTS